MAMVTHTNGDQLSQTRAKARANFAEVVTLHAEVATADMIVVGSGQGLEQFRANCQTNFEFIADALSLPVEAVSPVSASQEFDFSGVAMTVGETLTITSGAESFVYTATGTEVAADIIAAILTPPLLAFSGAVFFDGTNPSAEILRLTQPTGSESPIATITIVSGGTGGNPISDLVAVGVAEVLLATTVLPINDGSMLWRAREILNANFVLIAAA
jgi:hypothetical protein